MVGRSEEETDRSTRITLRVRMASTEERCAVKEGKVLRAEGFTV